MKPQSVDEDRISQRDDVRESTLYLLEPKCMICSAVTIGVPLDQGRIERHADVQTHCLNRAAPRAAGSTLKRATVCARGDTPALQGLQRAMRCSAVQERLWHQSARRRHPDRCEGRLSSAPQAN